MSEQERLAVQIFLNDLFHHKQVKKRFQELKVKFSEVKLLDLITEMKRKEIIDNEEVKHLNNKISELFRR